MSRCDRNCEKVKTSVRTRTTKLSLLDSLLQEELMEAKTEVESIPPVIAKGLPATAEAAKEVPVNNEDNVPDDPDVNDVVAPKGYVYEGRGKDTSRDTKSVRA